MKFKSNVDVEAALAVSDKITAGKGVQFTGGTIGTATTVLHTNNVVYTRGGSAGMFLQNSDGSDGIFIANDHVRFETSSSEKMRIDSLGNVGIGTSSPNQKLQVGGNLHVYDEEGDTDASIFLSTGTSDVTTVKIASNGGSFFNAGNVGVGTTSPDKKLHIIGTSSDTAGAGLFAIEGDAGNVSWVFRSTDTGDNLAIDREYGGAGTYYKRCNASAFYRQRWYRDC